MDKIECPICGEKMRFNESTQVYTCSSCGKVLKKDEIGEAKQVTKANNIKLASAVASAVAATTSVVFIGLMLLSKEFGNNNSINNGPKADGTRTETESDYNINNDDLSEKTVLKDIEEDDVIVTIALPEGYEPIKIDGKYYGEKITKVTKPVVGEIIYGLPADKLDQYNVIDKKGVNKDNPEETISLIASTESCTEIIYGLPADKLDQYNIIDKKGVNKDNPEETISLIAYTGRYETKVTTSRVLATVVKITKINNTYRMK